MLQVGTPKVVQQFCPLAQQWASTPVPQQNVPLEQQCSLGVPVAQHWPLEQQPGVVFAPQQICPLGQHKAPPPQQTCVVGQQPEGPQMLLVPLLQQLMKEITPLTTSSTETQVSPLGQQTVPVGVWHAW